MFDFILDLSPELNRRYEDVRFNYINKRAVSSSLSLHFYESLIKYVLRYNKYQFDNYDNNNLPTIGKLINNNDIKKIIKSDIGIEIEEFKPYITKGNKAKHDVDYVTFDDEAFESLYLCLELATSIHNKYFKKNQKITRQEVLEYLSNTEINLVDKELKLSILDQELLNLKKYSERLLRDTKKLETQKKQLKIENQDIIKMRNEILVENIKSVNNRIETNSNSYKVKQIKNDKKEISRVLDRVFDRKKYISIVNLEEFKKDFFGTLFINLFIYGLIFPIVALSLTVHHDVNIFLSILTFLVFYFITTQTKLFLPEKAPIIDPLTFLGFLPPIGIGVLVSLITYNSLNLNAYTFLLVFIIITLTLSKGWLYFMLEGWNK